MGGLCRREMDREMGDKAGWWLCVQKELCEVGWDESVLREKSGVGAMKDRVKKAIVSKRNRGNNVVA